MTVRFKCKSEYQKSYGVSRSRSVSPQRCAPLAGLRSDQMGISREPGLQRRRRPGPGVLAQSFASPLHPSDPQQFLTEPTANAHRKVPSAASRTRSAHIRDSSPDPKPTTPPGSQAEPETPARPRSAADPGPPGKPQHAAGPGPSAEPGTAGKSTKPHTSQPNSHSQPSRLLTAAADGQQPSANEVDRALWRRAGLRLESQRSGGQRSEYDRQFGWKKPATAASPILTAEQVLYSSSRSVPPFKKNPVSMETEYRQSFHGLAPPTGPRFRKHLEHQRVPIFHTQTTNKKRREGLQRKPRPKYDATPPPLVQRGHRMLTEYESSFRSPLYRIPEETGATDGDISQVQELRQKALSYRRRAWGTNFSRYHLSQLLSEHNALWEATDTTDSATYPPTPRLTLDPCRDPDGGSTSCVEALDLASSHSSNSSERFSVAGSGETHSTNKNTQTQASPNAPVERQTVWEEKKEEKEEEEEEGEQENTDEEEGRLPTPRLMIRPVQRTHHDLTTPAKGGAILVGKPRSHDESSPYKQQRSGSAVSMAARTDPVVNVPVRQTEAWSENHWPLSSGPSPVRKPASKTIRLKQSPPPPVAPPPLGPPLLHCIQGTLRHPDFQHNGELGLRFRELQCSGGGCGSDNDDRLSVMSWRSAASCSVASAVLERAQKRRENFWGKR